MEPRDIGPATGAEAGRRFGLMIRKIGISMRALEASQALGPQDAAVYRLAAHPQVLDAIAELDHAQEGAE